MRISTPGTLTRAALCAVLALACAAFFVLPASAAISYKAVTETTSDGGGQPMKMEVTAHIDGENGRIEFNEASGNPVLADGNYLVTKDGARTMYLVSPKEETYSEWDLAAMMRFAGDMMNSLGGMVKMEFSDPQVETLLDEPGGTLLGLPVRHLRTKTRYTLKMKVMGMKRDSDVETTTDMWVTDQLPDAALGMWLRDDPPPTGNAELDEMIRSQMVEVSGFPLKTEAVTVTRSKNQETVSRSVTEVTELDRDAAALPAASFEVPSGYEERPLVPEGEDGENPLSGLFGGRDVR